MRTRALLTLFAIAMSCKDVVPEARVQLPTNTCPLRPCEGYVKTSVVKAECVEARCEVRAAFDFVLMVRVPDRGLAVPAIVYGHFVFR